jgi:hypothetical protein
MAGLVPAIHAVTRRPTAMMDDWRRRGEGRDKPGHDGDGEKTRRNTLMSQA